MFDYAKYTTIRCVLVLSTVSQTSYLHVLLKHAMFCGLIYSTSIGTFFLLLFSINNLCKGHQPQMVAVLRISVIFAYSNKLPTRKSEFDLIWNEEET